MSSCMVCMKKPLHPDKRCCPTCQRDPMECEVWHNCGKDCSGWVPDGVVMCRDCEFAYESSGSSLGWKCKAWGAYGTDCECDPSGFCYKGNRRDDHGEKT